MRKLILIAPMLILACNFLFPISQADGNPLPASFTPVSAQPALSTPEADSSSSFSIVRIHIKDGDLLTQLSAQAQKAKELNRKPFIEFDATWCPPCIAIDKSIKANDAITMQAFEGIYLVRADVDEWGWGDGKNFVFDGIPIYFELDKSGKPTGNSVNGGAWNEDIPKNFAPVLDRFFHTP